MRVLVLLFDSDLAWQDCCDGEQMRRKWGADAARRISRRLQQLEAMTTLADLKFMPFDVYDHEEGVVELPVDGAVSVYIKPGSGESAEDRSMHGTIVVMGVRSRVAR